MIIDTYLPLQSDLPGVPLERSGSWLELELPTRHPSGMKNRLGAFEICLECESIGRQQILSEIL